MTGINQLCVVDITHIQMGTVFVYLAVVGWALDSTLEDDLPLAALSMAYEQRQPPADLVHHSDRDSQCASGD